MAADDGEWVGIVGFGSLLSPRSAQLSFPSLRHFRIASFPGPWGRPGIVRGYRRIFDHVGVIFIEKGLVEASSNEIASVAAEPDPASELVVATFEIHASDVPSFRERERFFRIEHVDVVEHPSHPWTAEQRAWHAGIKVRLMCMRFSSEDELVATNFSSRAEYEAQIRAWYTGAVFRKDILPCRVYLKHCLTAAQRLSDAAYRNFLTTTYLADGERTLGDYLAAHPTLLDGVVLGKFDRYQG